MDMVGTNSTSRRFFTDDEWRQIREGWAEIHEDTARTLSKVRKDYKRGSKMRRRLDAVMKHGEQVLNFDLCVLEALQEMDKILHPESPSSTPEPSQARAHTGDSTIKPVPRRPN